MHLVLLYGLSFSRRPESNLSKLALLYKTFGVLQNFCDQFRRRRLHINSQQPLGARCPKQHPGIGAISILGSVEKDLHAIAIFLA